MKTYWVYAGSERDLTKIGVSANILGRMQTLQAGRENPLHFRFTRIGEDRAFAFTVERFTHYRLHHRRLHGEWFSVSGKEASRAIRAAHRYLLSRVEAGATRDEILKIVDGCRQRDVGKKRRADASRQSAAA